MKVILVDDNPLAIEHLINEVRCRLDDKPCEIYTFSAASQLLEKIDFLYPDAIFIDIDMPEMDGFSLTQELRERKVDVPIVYVTAHEELIIQSFRYKPLGFVRKTHLESELDFALETIMNEINQPRESVEIQELRAAGGQVHIIQVCQICYIESMKQRHQIELTLTNERKILTRGTLREFMDRKEFMHFVPIDSGVIANLELFHIVEGEAAFENGLKLHISRRKLPEVMRAYQQFKRRLLL